MNGSKPLAQIIVTVNTEYGWERAGKSARELLRECHELLKAGNAASDQKALRLAKQACTLRPADGACYVQAARALKACGHHGKALKALERAETCPNGGGEAAKELARRLRKTQQVCSLLSLPDELIVRSLAYLTVPDVARVQRTNKRLNTTVRSHCELWRRLPRIAWTHDNPRWMRTAIEGVKDIVRRADGKLYTVDLDISDRKKSTAHTELILPLLEAIPAEFLCELSLALKVLVWTSTRGPLDIRVADEVLRLCRDGVKLECLSLDVGEHTLSGVMQPTALWPRLAPPLTSLALKSACRWNVVIDWLAHFKDTLESFIGSLICDVAQHGENGPVEVSLPKLTTLTIHPVNAGQESRGAKAVRLSMPALKELAWGCLAMDTVLVSDILTPSIERLTIDLIGKNQEALCAALPSMTMLERLALMFLHVDGKYTALRVLADNPTVPIRRLHIHHAHRETGADVVRLVGVRLQGRVPLEEIRLIGCPDLLPQHAMWLRRNVKAVFISAFDK